MRRLILLCCASLLWAGCAHNPVVVENGVQGLSAEEYNALIEKNTQKSNRYAGFYQVFQADITILTSDVQSASLRQRAYFFQWNKTQYQTEREKILQSNSASSHFFMRFFTPEKEYNELQKPNSIWKIYLDFNGQRFEGKFTRLKQKYVELQATYPYLDHFSTPYDVTFNVPMTTLEAGKCTVTLTSSLGSAEFAFPVVK